MRESFQDFIIRYSEKEGTSSISEPYFYTLIAEIVGDNSVSRFQEITVIPDVVKKFDFFVNPNILLELKKNIDNVESDLLKWILLKDDTYKRIQLVWEEEDNSSTQYSKILEYAVSKRWIDAWFYFTPERFDKELHRLRNVLLS